MLSVKPHTLRLLEVPLAHRHRPPSDRRFRVVRTASKVPDASEVPDVSFNFVARYQAVFRALPLYAGGLGIVGVLVNRVISGVSEAAATQLVQLMTLMGKAPTLQRTNPTMLIIRWIGTMSPCVVTYHAFAFVLTALRGIPHGLSSASTNPLTRY